ncbi:MAG: hypothetical protein NTW05_17560 [Pseudonocardiales bacterium]|nr:hypothetical protein [Pseudonocardiales bacterium]
MLVLIALVVAVLVAVVLWRAMSAGQGQERGSFGPPRREVPPRRVSGPDDDPDFLRQLDERVRRPEDPPA